MDNSGASIRDKLAAEMNARRQKLQHLNMLWEAKFIAAKEKEAEKVRVFPVAVGDLVRTRQ